MVSYETHRSRHSVRSRTLSVIARMHVPTARWPPALSPACENQQRHAWNELACNEIDKCTLKQHTRIIFVGMNPSRPATTQRYLQCPEKT